MKIAIIGSGAMGCLYGAYLSKKNKVIMVDVVDKVVDTICEKGITIKENDGSEHHYKENITAYHSGKCHEKVDLIIMFVKSTYLEDALEQNKDLFHDDTIVMSLQNGAGNDRKIENMLKKKILLLERVNIMHVLKDVQSYVILDMGKPLLEVIMMQKIFLKR